MRGKSSFRSPVQMNARPGDRLAHPVRLTHRAPERRRDRLPLPPGQRFRARDRDAHGDVTAPQPQDLLRQRVQRRGVAREVHDPVAPQRVQVVRDQVESEMVGGHVELLQGGVPHPERRPPPRGGNHELSPEHGPAVAARQAVPAPRSQDRQGVQRSHRPVRAPQHERLAGRAAGVLLEHPARIAVIRDEGGGVLAHPVVVEDRPVLEKLPGRPITLPASRRPPLAVIRHAGGGPVQHVPQALLPPGVPLRRAPVLALLGLGDEARGLATVARPAQIPAAQRSGDRAGG